MPDRKVRARAPRSNRGGGDRERHDQRAVDADNQHDVDAHDHIDVDVETNDQQHVDHDGGLFYRDLTLAELIERARGGDAWAQHDIQYAAAQVTPPTKRGRPPRAKLRCELQETLAWYLRERDDESLDALITTCRTSLPPGRDVDEAVMLGAIHSIEADEERRIVESVHDLTVAVKFTILDATAQLAIALNLFGDADGNPSIADVAQRFRKARTADDA